MFIRAYYRVWLIGLSCDSGEGKFFYEKRTRRAAGFSDPNLKLNPIRSGQKLSPRYQVQVGDGGGDTSTGRRAILVGVGGVMRRTPLHWPWTTLKKCSFLSTGTASLSRHQTSLRVWLRANSTHIYCSTLTKDNPTRQLYGRQTKLWSNAAI